MAWTHPSADRWVMFDDPSTRHFLLRANGRSVELHGHTIHVYDGPATVADPLFPLGQGEAHAVWVLTDPDRTDLVDADDQTAWAAMGATEYTVPVVSQPPPDQPPPDQPGPPPPPLPVPPPPSDDPPTNERRRT